MSRAVKRGDQTHNRYLAQKAAAQEQRELNYWWLNRQFVLDGMLIALGSILEETMTTEEIYDFMDKLSDAYMQVEHDIALSVSEEANEENLHRDKVGMTWVSKEQVDRLLRQYVRPEEFKSFDERFYDVAPQPYTAKDLLIVSLQKTVAKRDDEIVKLKGQIKLLKVKHDGNSQ